jgi:hypothetical protein
MHTYPREVCRLFAVFMQLLDCLVIETTNIDKILQTTIDYGEKNNKKLKDVSLMRRCLPENWNQKFN